MDQLDNLRNQGFFSDLDVHFARFLSRLAGMDRPELSLAYALTSWAREQGHICLDLEFPAGPPFPECLPESEGLFYPSKWIDLLQDTPVVGRPGDFCPLILSGRRLYLHRYWKYEQDLITFIQRRDSKGIDSFDPAGLQEKLNRLFPPSGAAGPDWQKTAALIAALKPFCVISGGPGTGKTTTVAKILALLLELNPDAPFRISLAAPTGKAAARLQESLTRVKKDLQVAENVKALFPEEAQTLHRLLGVLPEGGGFRQGADNPLEAEAVIVDEASMVDLALLAGLTAALPDRTRLILLGDQDQLASVEAGAVLGDICATGRPHGFSRPLVQTLQEVFGKEMTWPVEERPGRGLPDCIVPLRRNYRFGADSGIGAVSRLINAGAADSALDRIRGRDGEDIGWRELPPPERLSRALRERVQEGFSSYLKGSDPEEVFKQLTGFRILCALREGPYGVQALNVLVEQHLKREGLIRPEGRWYRGRPILITQNDYTLRLFNGDVGVILPDPGAAGELRAWFPGEKGPWRKFLPRRLPAHETVYALTVHKSQGSEFDRVLLVLPDRDTPVLTRELVYTGITRARERVEIWGREAVFRQAVARRIRRSSGLREALWGD
ncbi:MAG: exodeoxyribonuclease V subunit alpha [Deltaproteobacteria bacterium]|nr:exodeoxyribonuclease V subunit alpha [Deltaproteobacteria bacterium]